MGERNLYPNSQLSNLQEWVGNLNFQNNNEKSFVRLEKGSNVYIPGQAANYLYVVIKGSIKTYTYLENGQELVGSILREGDLFGEESLQSESKGRQTYAQSREKSTIIYRINAATFWEAIKTDHNLCVEVIKLLSKRITNAEEEKRRLKYISASQKMIAYLKHMAEKFGVKVGFETVFENNLTHKELGNLLGVSRQTVTSLLNDYKRANLINFDKKRILIRDFDTLSVKSF